MGMKNRIRCGACGAIIGVETNKERLVFQCAKCNNQIDLLVPPLRRSTFKLSTDPVLVYEDSPSLNNHKTAAQHASKAAVGQRSSLSVPKGPKNNERKSSLSNATAYFMINSKYENDMRQYIQMSYPELLSDCASTDDAVEYVLKHVFSPKIKGRYVITNNSYALATGGVVERLSIRSVASNFLTSRLYEPDRQLRVSGGLTSSGTFLIDRIDIIREAPLMFNERAIEFSIQYSGAGSKDTCLRYVAQDVPTYSKEMQNELSLWSKYLDWKQRLAEVKIRSVKYIF